MQTKIRGGLETLPRDFAQHDRRTIKLLYVKVVYLSHTPLVIHSNVIHDYSV